jgi:hypothetical protein
MPLQVIFQDTNELIGGGITFTKEIYYKFQYRL